MADFGFLVVVVSSENSRTPRKLADACQIVNGLSVMVFGIDFRFLMAVFFKKFIISRIQNHLWNLTSLCCSLMHSLHKSVCPKKFKFIML